MSVHINDRYPDIASQHNELRSSRLLFRRRSPLPSGLNRLWKVHSGLVRTLTWDNEGYLMTLGFWGPGSIVGMPLVQVRPFEIQCVTEVVAEAISPLQPLPPSALVAQANQAVELLRILHHRQTDMRLLQFLCWLVRECGVDAPKGRCLLVKITHQEIADAISATRVTITRVLKQFKEEGKLYWSSRERVVYHHTLREINPTCIDKIA